MEFSALGFYRIAHQLWLWKVPFIPRLIDLLSHLIFTASLPHNANIGEGTEIMHRGSGVLIGTYSHIGKDVVIAPYVMIGARMDLLGVDVPVFPRIEDEVVIGAGAIVMGDITVGRGALIGAGAVVVKDVPPGAVVVGNPGRIVGMHPEGAKKYLQEAGGRRQPDLRSAKTSSGSPVNV